jgi:4-hydroxythreonine-4-phosphate dehydrogenase
MEIITPASPITPTSQRPRLVIPIGDPAGIGLEVTLKALMAEDFSQQAAITLVGDRDWIQAAMARWMTQSAARNCPILNIAAPLDQVVVGVGNAASGAASFQYLSAAIDRTLAGTFDAIVTAPIAKSAWTMAGHPYPGQTELLAEKANIERFGMLFVGRSPQTGWVLRTLLATVHIPLRAVPEQLNPDVMTRKLTLLLDCLQQDFGLGQPTIAIAGLNPHSGELGQLGREELDWLQPWLEQMRDRFPQATLEGLIPPDTLWVKPGQAWFVDGHVGAADGYLALYHDQGLIPVKLMAFDRAVNTTIGLPFVRTSPDHGTAFDIAGKGIANPRSMQSAIEWAIGLAQKRLAQKQLAQKQA